MPINTVNHSALSISSSYQIERNFGSDSGVLPCAELILRRSVAIFHVAPSNLRGWPQARGTRRPRILDQRYWYIEHLRGHGHQLMAVCPMGIISSRLI